MMVDAMAERQQLIKLLIQRSVKRGHFILASGKPSALYIDARITTMSPEGLAFIGPLAIEAMKNAGWEIDIAGGLTLGADPVAYSIAVASYWSPPFIRAFTVRKDPKRHGTEKLIEGPFRAGDRVVIVEDVITTGASALQAIATVKTAGGKIRGVLTLIDREDGGRETIEKDGYNVISLIRLSEITALMPIPSENPDSADVLPNPGR
jgi:orotate phosphoribosyltransferase